MKTTILFVTALLAMQTIKTEERMLQINSISGNAANFNPYANPIVPLCIFGNTPVCGDDDATYINECVARLLGVTIANDGWCTPDPVAPAVNPALAQTPDNGYLPSGATAIDPLCPLCNNNYNPVCGSNGATYKNLCTLLTCGGQTRASSGPCGVPNYTAPAVLPTCPCTFSFSPACGADGNTYQNACVLICAGTAKKSDTACMTPCACSTIYKPVCSTEMETFDNACLLSCDGKKKLHDGICPESNPSHCTHCAGYTRPVCGKNGVTYDNDCYLNCAKEEKYVDGPCPSNKACNCQNHYLPVCGIDHKTYRNQCLMECNNVKRAHYGVCLEQKVDNSLIYGQCRCSTKIKYVCGKDQRTYLNPCFLKCLAGGKGLHWGMCQPLNPNYCQCPIEKKPVCGADKKVYQNQCVLNCLGIPQGNDCGIVGNSTTVIQLGNQM